MGHVFHGIRTQGFHILSPIPCQLSYQATLCQESQTYGAVIIIFFSKTITDAQCFTASSVSFCWKLQGYVLIGTYFASCEKVPTGTFSSWDQVGHGKQCQWSGILTVKLHSELKSVQLEHNIKMESNRERQTWLRELLSDWRVRPIEGWVKTWEGPGWQW